jgi:excisionase family DNA binding protein
MILDAKANTNDVAISPKDQREIMEMYERIREVQAKLVGPDGKTEILPNNIYSFLCRLLADLKAGNSVTILQSKAELTTVEAAKLLGMSRQFLVNLLGQGELPYHKIGTHRRLYARDVLSYKSKRDSSRRKILDDLAKAEHEEGTYDRLPEQ